MPPGEDPTGPIRPRRLFRSSEQRRSFGLFLRVVFALIVSTLVPLFVGLARTKHNASLLSPFEQFAVGGFIFIVITLTTISYEQSQLLRRRQQEDNVWAVKTAVDGWLHNIATSFATIVADGPSPAQNLFAQHYARIIQRMNHDIEAAATQKEMRVDELTFGATDLLMKVIAEEGPHVLRLVHALDARPNNFDCTVWSRSYYTDLMRLARSGKVEVRRLFVYGDSDDLNHPLANLLINFHFGNKGHSCRTIPRAEWRTLAKGFGLTETGSEVGIWGDLLAYLAYKSSSQDMEGAYIAHSPRIERLKELFDAGWRLSDRPSGVGRPRHMSINELFQAAAVANSDSQ